MNVARLEVADARALPLADGSVDLIVTSPPYFGMRDYGVPGEIGHETDLSGYLAAIGEALGEAHRVLKDTGSLFLNIGDKFVSDNRGSGADRKRGANKYAPAGAGGFVGREVAAKGSLLGIPYRVAIQAVDAGWLWRGDIVWRKPNPVPDPAGHDRVSRVHEAILHLTKCRRYFAAQRGGHGGDVWDIPVQGYRSPSGRRHPAVMPEEIARRAIRGWCPASGLVLDPFVGSGTVAAVAVSEGRKAVGFDLLAGNIEIARERVGLLRMAQERVLA